MNLTNAVFMSIKDVHINNIISKKKNHEFRTIKPKGKVDYIIVYIPTPIKELKYILHVDKAIETPIKITSDGIGNEKFNTSKSFKLAYPIKHLYKLKEKITLEDLKKTYNFSAPQSFAYGKKYTDLLNSIQKIGYIKLY